MEPRHSGCEVPIFPELKRTYCLIYEAILPSPAAKYCSNFALAQILRTRQLLCILLHQDGFSLDLQRSSVESLFLRCAFPRYIAYEKQFIVRLWSLQTRKQNPQGAIPFLRCPFKGRRLPGFTVEVSHHAISLDSTSCMWSLKMSCN